MGAPSELTASPNGTTAAERRTALVLGAVLFTSMVPVSLVVAPLKELIDHRFQAGPVWTQSFMAANLLGGLLAAPLIALLADQTGRRTVIAAVALGVDALCFGLMGVMPTLPAMLAVRLVEGAAHILAISTLMGLAAGGTVSARRGRMMGLIGASMMLGTACGARLGGEVWRFAGQGLFVVAAGASLVAALAAWRLVAEPDGRSSRSSLRAVFDVLRRTPALGLAYAYAFVDRLCVGVVVSTFVLYLAEGLGLAAEARSRLLALFLLSFAGLVYPAGRLVDRVGVVGPIVLGSLAFGVLFAAYGIIPPGFVWAAMLASGVFSALMFAPNLKLCAELAPDDQRGAAFAGFNVAGSLGFLCGPLLGMGGMALLADAWGPTAAYRWTLAITGMVEVLCVALTLAPLIRLRRSGSVR